MEPETSNTSAHERAVITVRLTLLLLVIGAALFLFDGYGGAQHAGQERGAPAERFK